MITDETIFAIIQYDQRIGILVAHIPTYVVISAADLFQPRFI